MNTNRIAMLTLATALVAGAAFGQSDPYGRPGNQGPQGQYGQQDQGYYEPGQYDDDWNESDNWYDQQSNDGYDQNGQYGHVRWLRRSRPGAVRRGRLLLRRAVALRRVGAAPLLRLGLVPAPRARGLAPLHGRPLGGQRLRLDLGLLRAVRLGDLPLRPLGLGPLVGWLWVPGTDWGPAWVSWQHGDGYVGWAPLPPAVGFELRVGIQLGGFNLSFGIAPRNYTFVEERRFLDPRIGGYICPRRATSRSSTTRRTSPTTPSSTTG